MGFFSIQGAGGIAHACVKFLTARPLHKGWVCGFINIHSANLFAIEGFEADFD